MHKSGDFGHSPIEVEYRSNYLRVISIAKSGDTCGLWKQYEIVLSRSFASEHLCLQARRMDSPVHSAMLRTRRRAGFATCRGLRYGKL